MSRLSTDHRAPNRVRDGVRLHKHPSRHGGPLYEIDDEINPYGNEGIMAARINFALQHIDCPLLLLPRERAQLAKHISIRLNRNKGKRVYVAGGGSKL